jgi:hypothetical protein
MVVVHCSYKVSEALRGARGIGILADGNDRRLEKHGFFVDSDGQVP